LGWDDETRETFIGLANEDIKAAFEEMGKEAPSDEEIDERQEIAQDVEDYAQSVAGVITEYLTNAYTQCSDMANFATVAGVTTAVSTALIAIPLPVTKIEQLGITMTGVATGIGHVWLEAFLSDTSSATSLADYPVLHELLLSSNIVLVEWSYDNGGYIP